jgi:hypothetical protein
LSAIGLVAQTKTIFAQLRYLLNLIIKSLSLGFTPEHINLDIRGAVFRNDVLMMSASPAT